jgi:PAS domain S-box-containing protein
MAAGAIGVLGLLGALFDVAALKSVRVGWATMKVNTALCLVLAAVAMGTRSDNRGRVGRGRTRAIACASVVLIVGALSLLEWITGRSFGIDELILRDLQVGIGAGCPGRMSPTTAYSFVAIGASLFLRARRKPWQGIAGRALTVSVGVVGLVSLIGYLYGVGPTFGIARYTTQMAVHTTLGILLLVFASVTAIPDRGIVGMATSDTSAAVLLRWLMPASIILPVTFGWIRLMGQREGLYGTELGLALYASTNVLTFVGLVIGSASAVFRQDRARGKAEDALRRANEDLEVRVAARTAELHGANASLEREVAERKHAEQVVRETSALWRAILDSANFSVISTTPEGTILEFNSTAERWLGYRADEVTGKLTPAFIHDETEVIARSEALSRELGRRIEPGFEAFVAKTRVGGEDENEWTYIRKDGTRFPVRLSVTALRDSEDKIVGFLGVGKDITAQKLAEQEVLRAKEIAEAAMRARSNFLARMSHEIRTPMNGVIGMTDLALQTSLTDEQRDYLETARSSADGLLALINDILDFSKIDAGKLRLEAIGFSLRDCIGGAMKGLAHRAHAKGLELVVDIPPAVPENVRGDSQRIQQVLVNLVSNAIKFTAHGEVVLTVAVERQTSATVDLALRVSDTGIGIPADRQSRIFEAFTQVDEATTRKFGGTGLGLAICSQLVSLMGGRISVESALGRGSTFAVDLRLELDVSASSSVEPTTSSVRGISVLVIDDHAKTRMVLIELLEGWHMKPTGATGDGGLAAARGAERRSAPFQIILVDDESAARMGANYLDALAADGRTGVRLILLAHAKVTASITALAVEKAAARLLKPVRASSLLEAMQDVLADKLVKPKASRPASTARPAARPLRILMAEDNVTNRRIATAILAKAGHSIVAVENGREAVERLAHEPFDLVLMDVQMPEMDGLEATRTIRVRDGEGARVPIIGLTAQAMKGDRARCLEAGMDGYVTKPLDTQALFAEIDAIATPRAVALGKPGDDRVAVQVSAPFDRGAALRLLGGDAALLSEVAALFLRDAPLMLDELRAAIATGDVTAAERGAHKLRGALLNLAASSAAERAQTLEQAGRRGDTPTPEQFALLASDVRKLSVELTAMTTSPAATH